MRLNLRAAVLHVNTAGEHATSPTMRIARYVSREWCVQLVHDPESADAVLRALGKHRLDVLFVKHGILKFSNHREQALELYARADMIVDLQNDYTFKPDPRFSKANSIAPVQKWSTIQQYGAYYVNWNVLTWSPPDAWSKPPMPLRSALMVNDGIFYHGAYKDIRLSSFKRYLHKDAPYDITISTYRGRKKFTELNDEINFISPLRDPKSIGEYAATVYIEDDYSHKLYCSPANRFYECLQYGLAMFFDEATIGTMDKADFNVRPYVVASSADVARLLPTWRTVRARQRARWYTDFAINLRAELVVAARKTFGNRCIYKEE